MTIDQDIVTTAIHTSIGDRLAILREESNLTQSEIAEKMGMAVSSIARIETRTNDAMTVGNIFHYLNACGMRLKISFIK